MSEPPDRARALLALAAAADNPSAEERARIHAAFSARLAALGIAVPPAPVAAPAPVPPQVSGPYGSGNAAATSTVAHTSALSALRMLALVSGAGALVAGGLWLSAAPSRPVEKQPATAQRSEPAVEHKTITAREPSATPAQSTEPAAPSTPPTVSRARASLVVERARPVVAQRLARSVPPTNAAEPRAAFADSPDTLTAELALISRARSALHARDPSQALAVLRAHEREFPKGVLSEERAGLRALALCALPDRAAGLREREIFLRRAPDSVLTARVRVACQEPVNQIVGGAESGSTDAQ